MKYFIAFDFFDDHINKYWSGIVEIDLNETLILEVAKEKAKEVLPYYDFKYTKFKITAFNNITLTEHQKLKECEI